MILDTFRIIISWLTPRQRLSLHLSKEYRPRAETQRKDRFLLARGHLHFLGLELRVCTARGCTRWRAPWSLSPACLNCLTLACDRQNLGRDIWNALRVRPRRVYTTGEGILWS